MINLLYVVLIAMLAINISSDVLEGYGLMNNDYLPQIEQLEEYNRTLLERINNSRNDQATLSAQSIDATAGKLMGTLEELKEDIARKADKEKYETGKLKAKDDLNAVPEVFLSVTGGKGKMLRLSLEAFKAETLSLIKMNHTGNWSALIWIRKDRAQAFPGKRDVLLPPCHRWSDIHQQNTGRGAAVCKRSISVIAI